MIVPLAEIVDANALLNVVWASFAAVIGGTISFSMAIIGATRFGELRRAGRPAEAGAFAAIGILGALVFVAAAVLGLTLMIDK
jgi:hypothetical protein